MFSLIELPLSRFLTPSVLILVLSVSSIGYAKYVKGALYNVQSDWLFITRFCFLSQNGELHFNFTFTTAYQPVSLLLYYDTYWPDVYPSDKSCFEKQSPPYIVVSNGQVYTLREGSYCTRIGNFLNCSSYARFRSSRERWWFVVVSRCYQQNVTGFNLNYEILMTNGEQGDIFYRQFSADEFYILEVDIAFLFAIFFLFVLSIVVAVKLQSRQLFHTTFKLYMISLFFDFFRLLVMCISYGKYANDGRDNYGSKTFGEVLGAISSCIFLLLLILMAKGFTITRGRLSNSSSIKIAIFMTSFIITYAVLFIYEAVIFDPGLVLYLYESPPGYGLLGLQLVAWLWFCYAIFFTLKHYPGKSKFYMPFFVIYTFWFWCEPVIILIANFALGKWVRAKVVNGIQNAVAFAGFSFFLFLTRPSHANKNFPYHVRTTQVGVMSDDYNREHIYYVPTTTTTTTLEDANIGPNFTELFTVTPKRQTLPPIDQNKKNISSDSGIGGGSPTDPLPHEPRKTPIANLFITSAQHSS